MKKYKLDLNEQIQYMLDKGIKFDIYKKEEAEHFLKESNYFFKLKAFAKNYDKDENDKYKGLDFAYLREISILDTLLRDIILELCLACEHLLKTQINAHCSDDKNQDGYKIVDDFLSKNRIQTLELYKKGRCNIYQKNLIEKYFIKKEYDWESHFTLWNFIEILTFSEFIKFYDFYSKNSKNFKKYPFIKEIKNLRNAAAHNCCIFTPLSLIETTFILLNQAKCYILK